MMKESIAVIDFGTSNVRASIVDAETGRTVCIHSERYRIRSPKPGHLELAVDDIWINAQKCVKQVMDTVAEERKYHVAVISFSYFGDNLIMLGADGKPLHNLILCFDPRGEEEAEKMNRFFGKEKVQATIGAPFSSGATPAKLMWVKKHLPDVFKDMRDVYTNQQYIMKMLGLPRLNDYSMAGRMMMLDIDTRSWSEEILEYVGLKKEMLGEAAPANTIAGEIEFFGEYRLPYPIPVAIGAHDASCGMIGTGITSKMTNAIGNGAGTFDHYGFTDFTGLLRGSRTAGCLDGINLKLSAVPSGSLIAWFMNTIHGDTEESSYQHYWRNSRFDGTSNLIVVPTFFSGQGKISGLDLSNTRQDIFTAIIEAVTFRAQTVFESLVKEREQPVNVLRIGGGPSRSEPWNRHKANTFGVTVQRLRDREVSSVGAMILGAYAVGMHRDIETAMDQYVHVETEYHPDMELHMQYKQRRASAQRI